MQNWYSYLLRVYRDPQFAEKVLDPATREAATFKPNAYGYEAEESDRQVLAKIGPVQDEAEYATRFMDLHNKPSTER